LNEIDSVYQNQISLNKIKPYRSLKIPHSIEENSDVLK